jgi:hypothetical protein
MSFRKNDVAHVEITALAAGAGPPANSTATRLKFDSDLAGLDNVLAIDSLSRTLQGTTACEPTILFAHAELAKDSPFTQCLKCREFGMKSAGVPARKAKRGGWLFPGPTTPQASGIGSRFVD